MWWRDSKIVKGTSSVWSVLLSTLALLAVVWLIAMNVSDPIWRWSIAGIGTIVCLGSPGGLASIYWLCSSRFRRQWSEYRRGGPPPGSSDVPEPIRIPRKQFDAAMGGAMAAMREFPDLARHAKSRLRDHDRPIVQADLEEILRMLADAKRRIDAEMRSDIAKSTDTGDAEWDKAGYNVLVAPTIQMANSPQAIIDLTLAAAENGAKSAKLNCCTN